MSKIDDKTAFALALIAKKGWVFEGKAKDGCVTPGLAQKMTKAELVKRGPNKTWSATLGQNSGSFSFRPTYEITEAGRAALAKRLEESQGSY